MTVFQTCESIDPTLCKAMPAARRPLLVVDGDNVAHRSYHALPKSIRRAGSRGAGAIVGFANFLLRLYESERPGRWMGHPWRANLSSDALPRAITAAVSLMTNW
jgi:5'-3' exonuclease